MIKWLLGTPPPIGSKWYHYATRGNPFVNEQIEVLDVKRGFVQYQKTYQDLPTLIRSTQSCSIREFRSMYREVTWDS